VLFSPGWRAPIRQSQVLVVFNVGLLLGGILSATVLWLVSGLAAPLPATVRGAAIVVVAALALARELGWVAFPMPQNARQIPQDVLQRHVRLGALQFGFELGTGVRTYVSANAPYVLAIGLVLSHQGVVQTMAAGAGFGVGRAVTATIRFVSRGDEWDDRRLTRMTILTNGIAVAVFVALGVLVLRSVFGIG
jgi:hypothetical protein